MPDRPLKPCNHPGCGELVVKGYCPAHQKQVYRRQDERRGSAASRGYDADWRRLRRMVLSGEPLCRHCRQEGRLTIATEVDHIRPIADGGARLSMSNTQPLCKQHHSRKTMSESVNR